MKYRPKKEYKTNRRSKTCIENEMKMGRTLRQTH